MESATILMPPSTDLSGILLLSEPNSPEGPVFYFFLQETKTIPT